MANYQSLFLKQKIAYKKKKDFEQSEQKALPQGQTTNNVFVGSTSDLQRMLQNEMIDVTPKE